MKIFIKTSIIIIIIQLYSLNSFSQIRTLCVKGIVQNVEDLQNVLNGGIIIGDSINGTIKYDLSIIDNNSMVQVGDYYNTLAPAGFRLNINGGIFMTDSNNVNLILETVDNYGNLDNIGFRSYNNIFVPAISGIGFETHISWQLDDTNQVALSNTNIPSFINLNSWQQSVGLNITGSNMFMDTSIFIKAIITSVDTCENVISSIGNPILAKKMELIYPNPMNSSATIQFDSVIENGELNIFNLYGQKIKTIYNISGNRIKINRDNLSSGIYYVQLSKDGKTFITNKLIIAD